MSLELFLDTLCIRITSTHTIVYVYSLYIHLYTLAVSAC